MTTRLTESRLRQIIRKEIRVMTEAPMLRSSGSERSIAEPRVAGLKYQSAGALSRAVDSLMSKLVSTKNPKSPSGRSYGVTIISGLSDPKYSMSALKMFNDFANKMGLNSGTEDDSIKRSVWNDLCIDARTGVTMPGAIPWSRT